MAITYGYFNSVSGDRKYNAEMMSKYFSGIISRGVLQSYNQGMQILQNNGFNVTLKPGKAYFTGGQWVENSADYNIAIEVASLMLPRIDRIVLRCDKSNNERKVSIVVKKGTPSATPYAPVLTSTEFVEELSLCQIYIASNATEITQANITDERPNDSLCGFTHQLFDQVSTTNLFAQYDDAFNAWFKEIKQTLSTATLISQYTSSYKTAVQDQTNIPINISQYNPNFDILNVFINGMKLIQDVDYTKYSTYIILKKPVDSGTQIEFEVFKSIDGSDAETVIGQVNTLQAEVNKIEQYNYYCNGINDNKLLTELCSGFLESTGLYNNHNKLTVNVIGQFGINSTKYNGETGKTYSMAFVNTTTKELCVDFANCDTITPNGALVYAQNITIKNLSVKHENETADNDIYTLSGVNSTVEGCSVTGQYNGGTCTAIYLSNSRANNCKINVKSNGTIYGINGTSAIVDNCNVEVLSTALSAYGMGATSSRANNCNFKGTTQSTATSASGNGALCCGTYSNCLFEGYGGLKGHGFYLREGYLVSMSNCVCRGYTKDATNGVAVGLITTTSETNTIILHGINCNSVTVTGYSQLSSMTIPGGYGVYDGLFYASPTIYNAENVVSHGAFNRNRV